MDNRERYYQYKPKTTTIAISINMHEALKVFAASRQLAMKEATAYLIKKALLAEYEHE